jgi:hypothetical protein
MASRKDNFSTQLSPENYNFLSAVAYAENPSWPATVDRLINRMLDEMRSSKKNGALRLPAVHDLANCF